MLVLERMANLLDPTPSGPSAARVGLPGATHCLLQLTLPSGTCLERGLLGWAQAWLGCICRKLGPGVLGPSQWGK